jgi:hypothetical protein
MRSILICLVVTVSSSIAFGTNAYSQSPDDLFFENSSIATDPLITSLATDPLTTSLTIDPLTTTLAIDPLIGSEGIAANAVDFRGAPIAAQNFNCPANGMCMQVLQQDPILTPEPATFGLMGSALLGLGLLLRRRA